MWVHSLICPLFFAFVLCFCYASEKKIEVVGIAECADCKERNIKSSQAFSGLHITIECTLKNGKVKRRGEGKLVEEGKFKVLLPEGILKEGKLNEECYAQLQSASAACPTHNGLEESKIVVFKSKTDGKYRLKPKGNLKVSTTFCTSDFPWPFSHFPTFHPWKKNFPPWNHFGHPWVLPPWSKNFPPWNHFGHPWVLPPFPPIFYKPFPPIYMSIPPPPVSMPKPPVCQPPMKLQPQVMPPPSPAPINKPPLKPLPPPVPIKPPVHQPLLPPIPIYKPPVYQPLPPPIPIYKPKPPPVKLLPPPVPIYKPPVYQPLPPPIPMHKPKPPVKPLHPPIPIYKPKLPPVKPLPPSVPVYKPPVYQPLPPPIPVYKPKPPPSKAASASSSNL
ncbi:Proline-rich protein 2 [Abeliophyllum distichum]|uniref:Proline-rich protein 2 n=1 Tax=Abeliophyllum distichum TaxID=126358 RepID=A0ABD1TI14_9LAMI